MRFRPIALAAALLCAAAVPGVAGASEIIARNATAVKLQVNKQGQALVSYTSAGKRSNVLVWGAVNALHPTTSRPQVAFKVDYSGGYGTFKKPVWKTFKNGCRAYDGPQLQWLVTACKAPDGSYWALQAWQRMLPNYGVAPTAKTSVWELRLSHWTGPIAELTVHQNWAYRQFHHIFGEYTYRGRPVHGFKSTSVGVPLDTYGRNLFVDTLNSAYGGGWNRENSFLMHKGSGKFCYGFYKHQWAGRSFPSGMGTKYRATIIGPGVTPDVYWEAEALGAYDRDFDLAQHEAQREFYSGTAACKPV
jgi:hypothetical protein